MSERHNSDGAAKSTKAKHALLLNRLVQMQDAPYYATAKDELAWAEKIITGQEDTIEQLQAELASATASKKPKLPEWNDKEAEWQSYPPGATLMNGNGKATIVKEKFYPADKELIDKLQAENAQLREALEKISSTKQVAKSLTNPEPPTIEMLLAGLSGAIRMAKEALASTDSSNWLAEQKAQWRREVLKQVLRLESPDEYDYMVVLSSDIRRMAESTKAETDSLQNPAGKY